MDAFKLSDAELAAISAELDAELADFDASETEDEPVEEIQTEVVKPQAWSLRDSSAWQSFLQKQQEVYDDSDLITKACLEVIPDLHIAPAEELDEIIEEQPLLIEKHEEPVFVEIEVEAAPETNDDEDWRREEHLQMLEEDWKSKEYEDFLAYQTEQANIEKERKARVEQAIQKQVQEEQAKAQAEYEKKQEAYRLKLQEERAEKELKQKAIDAELSANEKRLTTYEDIRSEKLREVYVQQRELSRMAREEEAALSLKRLKPDRQQRNLLTFQVRLPDIKASAKLAACISISLIIPKPEKVASKSPSISVELPKVPFITTQSKPEVKVSGVSTVDCLPFAMSQDPRVLELKFENIESISGLTQFANLQELTLSVNRIVNITNLPPSLRVLDLSQNSIAQIPKLFLPNLTTLNLDMNRLSAITGLETCSNLQTLSLNNNKLTSISGLQQCRVLGKLQLYRNEIASIPSDAFVSNPYLFHIDLGRNSLESAEFLKPLKLLRTVIIYENQLKTFPILQNSLLQELWLNGNHILKLDFLQHCQMLELLNLTENKLQEVQSFSAPQLRKLYVSINNILKLEDVMRLVKAAPNLTHFTYSENTVVSCNSELDKTLNKWMPELLPLLEELNRNKVVPKAKPQSSRSQLARVRFELNYYDYYCGVLKNKESIAEFLAKNSQEWSQLVARCYNLLQIPSNPHLCELETAWYKANAELSVKSRAARSIQGAWKRHLACQNRKLSKFKKSIPMLIMLQSYSRGVLARKHYNDTAFGTGVTKIQACYRGYRFRKRLKEALRAAKVVDIDMAEFEEVNFDYEEDPNDFELYIPPDLDFKQVFKPIEALPSIRGSASSQRPASEKVRDLRESRESRASRESAVTTLPKISNKEKTEQIAKEWNFTKPETMLAFEMRQKKKAKRRKPDDMTAEERFQKFKRTRPLQQ
mmetsp:Transcript_7253/g.13422  ORF Transcript_7253/g.13422 Transcript_7253/m.13422 type:complete len:932 (+) Transcript_7253:141-2936(+)